MTDKRLDRPENPDIEFTANVKARELRFERVPEVTKTRFHGRPERESVSGTERDNLPEEVQPNVTYRDAGIRLRIASKIASSNYDFQISSDKGRVETKPKDTEQKTGEQRLDSREEKE